MAGNEAETDLRVLDTWAVMAWLRDEPAAERMDRLWNQARKGKVRLVMSAVNLGEVFYLTARWRGLPEAEVVLEHMPELPLEIRPAPNVLIWGAARIKAVHRLSYADAFAVATAIRERAPLVTGEPVMRALARRGVLSLDWVRG